ncbi:MAG: IgGFc-binding protein [Deltaproteobacteria bacterium]|nr:IgGFc-binding protein [Deltaproteobacteria bacterium]
MRTLVLAVALMAAGCGGKPNESEYCVPGQVARCDAPGCASGGVKVCREDWSGYGECTCAPQSDAGLPPDGGPADGGATDAPVATDAATDAAGGDATAGDAAAGDGPPADTAAGDTAAQGDAAGSDAPAQSDAPVQHDAAVDGPPCSTGTMRCLDRLLQLCNGGSWQDVTTCPVRCDGTLGCIECTPNVNYCVGDTLYACTAQGHQGALVQVCNPGQCQGSACVDPCAALAASPSHLGCEHWATLTMNSQVAQGPGFNFTVAVVNPGPAPATVTVTGGVVLNRGQWLEFSTSSSFEVNGSQRFLLAQLVGGRQAGGSSATGDPAMSFVVPVEQFRSEYRVYVPPDYVSSAAIVAPAGTSVLLDGATVGGFAAVGSGAYAGATVATLTPGFHTLTGSAGFSVQLYGSAERTSYSYPAGLNLIPQP